MNPSTKTSRRRFAFWLGFGMFVIGERTGLRAMDDLAEATMRIVSGESPGETAVETLANETVGPPPTPPRPEWWTAVRNRVYRWYERQHYVEECWVVTGITRPITQATGHFAGDDIGYLSERLVPVERAHDVDRERLGGDKEQATAAEGSEELEGLLELPPLRRTLGSDDLPTPVAFPFGDRSETDAGEVSSERRIGDGRPPSKWLRSLNADEIRIWLAHREIPEAGVRGMTFWVHLTRDHSFDPVKIAGLTEEEQAALHGAAHAGY